MDDFIDPVEDRDEFIRKLDKILDWTKGYSMVDVIEAMQDPVKLQSMMDRKAQAELAKENYLQSYDNAATREERIATVGSVQPIRSS